LKKSTIVIICFLLFLLGASMVMMRSYELDLIHGVVLNTLIQKGPDNYSNRKVRQTFQAARASAEREGLKEVYLQELFSLSQRLEKVQELNEGEMDEILNSLVGETPRIEETKRPIDQ